MMLNVFGWLARRTLRLNLITQLLTLFSWSIMGIGHGFGYCICTDWHWRVREAMGIHDQARTYVQLLVSNVTGWLPPVDLTSTITGLVFFSCLIASLVLNIRVSRQGIPTKRQNANL